MADTTVKLKVLLESAGIKPTQKQLTSLNKKLTESAGGFAKVSNAANKTKRNLEGVAQRAGSAGKDFARMSQGMGGLVQAYATVAANVFALSSAFLVLRRTADLSSMIKSAEDFSSRFGVSVTRITKHLQEATGGAISFAEALPIVNKAISANVPIEKMEQLAVAATKASQTFGGSATEALNRFISAAQRGRVEIIQTLGIVIKTEQAYKDYGATIGKTALELSAFDRQQAILNATIEASQDVFDQVNIDPNPFQQLLTTITDLKDTVGVFITDALTPMFNAFNQSKAAAAALIAIIINAVGGRIFPEISKGITSLAIAGKESTKAAKTAAERAAKAADKVKKELGKTSTNTSIKQIKKEEEAFRDSLGKRIKAHKAFTNTIFKQNGDLNKAVLTQQRAALARELKAREVGKGMQQVFKGVPTAEVQRMLNVYNQIGLSIKDANIAQEKLKQSATSTTNALKIGMSKVNAEVAKFNAGLASLKSGLRSGFAQGFKVAEGKVVKSIKAMNVAWRVFMRDIAVGTAKSGSHLKNLGTAVGRTAGIVAGAFAGAFSIALSALTYIALLTFAWEKYGDTLRGITPEQRAVMDAAEEFEESLKKVNETLAKGIRLWGKEAPNSLKDFKSAFQFLSGSFESVAFEAANFSQTIIKELGNITVDQAVERMQELKQEIAGIQLAISNQDTATISSSLGPSIGQLTKIQGKTKEQREELEKIQGILQALNKASLQPFLTQFSRAFGFSKDLGIELTAATSRSTKGFESLSKSVKEWNAELIQIGVASGSVKDLNTAVEIVLGNFKNSPEETAAARQAILDYISGVSGELSSLNRQAASALSSLQETGNNFNTFILGLDKLRAQKSPFKEVFSFTINAENALRSLIETQDDVEGTTLAEAFESGNLKADLEYINQLLGGQTTSIQEAYDEAVRLRKVYQEQLQVQLTGAQQLKLIALEQKVIKDREIRSDEQRLQQVYDSTERQLAFTRKSADLKFAEAEAQRGLIAALGPITEENKANVELEELKLTLLERQLDAFNEQERRLLKFTEYKLTDIRIQKNILASAKSELNILRKASVINGKLVRSRADYYSLLEDQFVASKAILKIDKETIKANKARIMLTTIDSALRDRQLAIEDAKLLLLRQQTAELERQHTITLAGTIEQDSDRFFSGESIKNMTDIFLNTLAAGVNKLKPFMQTLGEGFVDTINGGVDAAVDKLFEGHGFSGFKDAVVEALKAGLRETFAEAFKAEIKKGIAIIFGPEGAEQKAEKRHNESINSIEALIDALNRNTTAQGGTSGAGAVASAAVKGKLPSIAGMDVGSIGQSIFGDLSSKNEGPTKTQIKTQTQAVEQGNETAEKGIMSAINTGEGIMGILWTMITTLITGFTSMITASALPFATGGVVKGGMGKITPMANGGITRGPNLALIGEGRNDEAVVPLPNNREIPVDLQGAAGDTINIEQNFDFRNADNSAIPVLRQEARAIEERTFQRVFSEINKGGKYARIVGRR